MYVKYVSGQPELSFFLPEIQVPLNNPPDRLFERKSLKEILSPKGVRSSGGVIQITESNIRPRTARMTSVAINMPFQFRSEPE